MKTINVGPVNLWSRVLMVSVFFAVFVLPTVPFLWQNTFYIAIYSLIYASAVFSNKKVSNRMLVLFILTFLLEWISGIFDMKLLWYISRGLNILFFIVIVVLLIRQVASAKEVNIGIIMDSVVGYLLIGLIFAIFVSAILQNDPEAYTPIQINPLETGQHSFFSHAVYYSLITQASVGYGDFVPLKPYTRSLAIFIAITGQFYLTTIVALLVGKFTSAGSGKA